MVKVVVINRHGSVNVSNYHEETDDNLYKIANANSSDIFKQRGSWLLENNKGKMYNYCVYGATDGKANYENKYEFPPPIDNLLLFNTCIVVKKKNETLKSLSVEEWTDIYDTLYGGFEDLDDSDEESEDEDEGQPRTKSGYVEDDFVVEDYEEESEEFNTSGSSTDGELDTDDVEEDTRPVSSLGYSTRSSTRTIPNTIFTELADDFESS